MDKKKKLLDSINFPSDLKKIDKEKLPELCDEIRHFLIDELSINPGHLASNLGVVELTVALHYIFDTPKDILVWDVGHQAYIHKILTGRKNRFDTNRKLNGLSGFPNPEESEYDSFTAGHASNSISAALGMSVAANLKKENKHVVAIIGDGSMSGGLAYEGLNNASVHPNDLLIILNDNHISIDKNVGGMSNYLMKITTSKGYNDIRWRMYKTLKKLGLINDKKKSKILRFGNVVKAFFTRQHTIFEGLDIRYFGPIDGQDIKNLMRSINAIKDLKGPKILHICTIKGKGYAPAEKDATHWHAPGIFNIKTGERANKPYFVPKKFQDIFGKTLLELADLDEKVVGITPAMPSGCGMIPMMKKYPERTFDVGIAEGHAVTFSAGLTKEGMIPFCNVYSSFSQRSVDNIIHDCAIQKAPVIICLDRSGLVGEDGTTHHGMFDISILRNIPNLIVSSPKDLNELRNLMFTAYKYRKCPFVIRYPRGKGVYDSSNCEMKELPIGKSEKIVDGEELVILGFGPFVMDVIPIVEKINKEGHNIGLYNMRFVKPLDENLLFEISKKTKKIITIEDGVISGGFGGAIDEFFKDNNLNSSIIRMGLSDAFVTQGSVQELREVCGLDSVSIEKKIREVL